MNAKHPLLRFLSSPPTRSVDPVLAPFLESEWRRLQCITEIGPRTKSTLTQDLYKETTSLDSSKLFHFWPPFPPTSCNTLYPTSGHRSYPYAPHRSEPWVVLRLRRRDLPVTSGSSSCPHSSSVPVSVRPCTQRPDTLAYLPRRRSTTSFRPSSRVYNLIHTFTTHSPRTLTRSTSAGQVFKGDLESSLGPGISSTVFSEPPTSVLTPPLPILSYTSHYTLTPHLVSRPLWFYPEKSPNRSYRSTRPPLLLLDVNENFLLQESTQHKNFFTSHND